MNIVNYEAPAAVTKKGRNEDLLRSACTITTYIHLCITLYINFKHTKITIMILKSRNFLTYDRTMCCLLYKLFLMGQIKPSFEHIFPTNIG